MALVLLNINIVISLESDMNFSGRLTAMAGKARILVVDDDRNIRMLNRDVLASAGYEVDSAEDALCALELLRLSRYDLVITDVHMPELNGIDFYTRAISDYPGLKDGFLFITGDTTSRIRDEIKRLDKKCLTKPFKIADLLGHVDMFIARPLEDLYRREEANSSGVKAGKI